MQLRRGRSNVSPGSLRCSGQQKNDEQREELAIRRAIKTHDSSKKKMWYEMIPVPDLQREQQQ
jgi:hypothetical protein